MFKTPILFLIFNRPDTTQRVFNRIRDIKPRFLFIAADGPRINKIGENKKCQQTRELVSNIDWECEVKTLFRDENLGCKIAVSSAITWFFEHVEQGIILEDDCLAHPSFFNYCQTLLDKYKDDKKVMHIGGNNFSYNLFSKQNPSYFFSSYALIWGWATWRRAWSKFDINVTNYENLLSSEPIKTYLRTHTEVDYWKQIFELVAQGFDSWAYIWQYSIWSSNGLSILPKINLVKNIGFGTEATHTFSTGNYNPKAHLKAKKITIKTHPDKIAINHKEDALIFRNNYLNIPTTKEKIIFKVNQILKKI
jgi:hypothetical protein